MGRLLNQTINAGLTGRERGLSAGPVGIDDVHERTVEGALLAGVFVGGAPAGRAQVSVVAAGHFRVLVLAAQQRVARLGVVALARADQDALGLDQAAGGARALRPGRPSAHLVVLRVAGAAVHAHATPADAPLQKPPWIKIHSKIHSTILESVRNENFYPLQHAHPE